jgi:hypothetical protein
MIFNKYEFTDEQWSAIRPTLYNTDEEGNETLIPEINAIVEIGHICHSWSEGDEPECTDLSTHYAVDMLLNEPLDTLNGYLVYPNPVGVHTFSGDNGLYLENFCKVYPDSPYCKIDE